MLKFIYVLAALLTISFVAVAQDPTATPDATPDAAGTAPTVVSITPDALSVDGAGVFTVTVTYEDPDLDAYAFVWSMVETNAAYWALPTGYFDQQTVGNSIDVTFRCYQPAFEATVQLVVLDLQGNQSAPASLTMTCNDDASVVTLETDLESTGAGAQDTAADPDTATGGLGAAPSVVSITPPSVILRENSETFATVTYADPDGDATQFVWLVTETDALNYTLPIGTFTQQVVGTEIPVRFFCTTTPFVMEVSLVVVDAQGNQSEPFPFEITCR